MSASQSKRIVAGVDGSPSSVRALEWAIRQAGMTGAVVDAIYAWHYPATYGIPVADGTDYAALSDEILTKAIAEAQACAPEARAPEARAPEAGGTEAGGTVEIRPHVVEGHPVQILLDAARGADLIVVGSRGHGGFSGALLGSVSQNVVHHSPCSVLVMRGSTA